MTEKPSIELLLKTGKFWTFANMLSISRIFIVIPIVYLILVDGSWGWLSFWVLLGMATDWFDGMVARWTNTVSEWGKILDPLADKIAAIAIVLALAIRGLVPWWLLGIVAGRDILLVVGGSFLAKRVGEVAMSVWTGKVTVTILAVMILASIIGVPPAVLDVWIYTSAILFIHSFFLYVLRFVHFLRMGKDSPFGALLDLFSNELTVLLLVGLYIQFTQDVFEGWAWWFFWVVLAWLLILLLLGEIMRQRTGKAQYLSLLHLPVFVAILLCLAMFLEPDKEVIAYGQIITTLLIGYSTLQYFSFVFKQPKMSSNHLNTQIKRSETIDAL